jgi:hypothetical protein
MDGFSPSVSLFTESVSITQYKELTPFLAIDEHREPLTRCEVVHEIINFECPLPLIEDIGREHETVPHPGFDALELQILAWDIYRIYSLIVGDPTVDLLAL